MKKDTIWILLTLIVLLCGCGESKALCGKYYAGSVDETAQEPYAPSETETAGTIPYRKETPDGLFEYEVRDNEVRILCVLADNQEIIVPETIDGYSVTTIGETAFYQKVKCRSVVLPQTLCTIENGAFYRCYSLEGIEIPESVNWIADDAFFRTPSLKYIHVVEGNSKYRDIDGVLFSTDGTVLYIYPEGRVQDEYAIPEHVTRIAGSAFGYYPAVRRLIVPVSVVELPDSPFTVFEKEITIITEHGSEAECYALKWNIPCCTDGN